MNFELPDDSRAMMRLLAAVDVVRKTPFHLFTFGETALPYKLVLKPKRPGGDVGVCEGEITVARPTIVRPGSLGPKFRGFFPDDDDDGPSFDPGHGFDDGYPNTRGNPQSSRDGARDDDDWDGAFGDGDEGERVVRFFMARGVKFGDLSVGHRRLRRGRSARTVRGVVDELKAEIVDEDDRTGILVAPHGLGGVALVRYAAECIHESAPGNVGELRERGFLP